MTGIENLTLAVDRPGDFQFYATLLLTLVAALAVVFLCLFAMSVDPFPWKTHWRAVAATVALAIVAGIALIPIIGWGRAYFDAHDQTIAALEDHYDLNLPPDEVDLSADAMTTVTAIDQRTHELVTVTVAATDGRVTVYGEHSGTRTTEFRTTD